MSARPSGPLPARPWVLGLACSHNGAACLLHGSELVVAVQEERLSRRKRQRLHAGRASLAVRYCLETAGIGPGELDLVVAAVQGSRRAPREALAENPDLRLAEHGTRQLVVPHHLAHAASAAALAGWDETAVLVLDGLGSPAEDLGAAERAAVLPGPGGGRDGWEIASLYRARGWGSGSAGPGRTTARLEPLEKHLVPGGAWLGGDPRRMRTFGSLGGLYAAASWQLFGDHRQAGKVMGLAAWGEPEIPVERFFRVGEDGRLDFSDAVPASWPPADRWATAPERAAALAASVQRALEEGVLHYARRLRELSGCRRLAYAGGVALNGPANERIAAESGFEELFVVPAAEDSGTAVGAAYWGLAELAREGAGKAPPEGPGRPRLARDEAGRRYSAAEIDAALAAVPGIAWRRVPDRRELLEATVDRLEAGEAVGWFQGGSELGPRALGQRSLLADPRPAAAKERLNRRIKRREPFRPFAPAVLLEAVGDWFDPAPGDPASPFMLRVRRFREDRPHPVPAVVHADGTGRLQTLDAESGPLRDLVAAFAARTGVPMLLDTSFNGPGEPIVETPEDALWCLLATGLDACVLEDRLVTRAPGVGSLLDLVPHRTGARPEVHTPDPGAASFVVFDAPTRWGRVPRYFGVGALAILGAVDGEHDGRALAARFRTEGAAPPPADRTAWIVETLERWSRHAGPDGHLPGGHPPVEVVETLAAEGVAPDGTVADEGAMARLLARLREAGGIRFEADLPQD